MSAVKQPKPLQKTKAHVRYRLSDGTIVPGATTVLSVLNKPALVKWANNLGLQGIDSTKYVDSMATIGTIAHYLIECYLKGETADLSEYSAKEIDLAENAVLKFYEWLKGKEMTVIFSEKQLVSERYKFGGTIDCFCFLDGVPTLLDFKTSKSIWPEHIIQLAAYKQLLQENGYAPKEVRVLRIGRDESEGFEERKETNLIKHWKAFKHCLALYQLKKDIGF